MADGHHHGRHVQWVQVKGHGQRFPIEANHRAGCQAQALFSALMLNSGTMTHRLQRLESSGRAQRLPNANDARSMLVQLTTEGLALIDRAVEAHVANEQETLAALPAAACTAPDDMLSTARIALEGAASTEPEAKRSKMRS